MLIPIALAGKMPDSSVAEFAESVAKQQQVARLGTRR